MNRINTRLENAIINYPANANQMHSHEYFAVEGDFHFNFLLSFDREPHG